MLLCFVVKKQLFDTRTPSPPPPTASVYQHTNNNSLKHPNLQSWQSSKWQKAISFILCKEWVHWRSIPSRRLWQLTKTARRWGVGANVVFTDTLHMQRCDYSPHRATPDCTGPHRTAPWKWL